MSNFTSALNGKSFQGMVNVTEQGLRGMITLRGDLASAELRKAATAMTGLKFPTQGTCVSDGDKAIAWMSPDEVLVMVPYNDVENVIEGIETALKGSHFLVANVSDARAVIRLEGAHVREAVAKLIPADLAASAFEVGQFRRSRLAQIAAAFWMRDEESLDLICFRSVADYAFDVLSRAALPETEVGYF
jgi:sarcosine oxidase subunit gamma